MHLGILVERAKVDERAARHSGARGGGGNAVWHRSIVSRRESIEHVADDEEQLAACRFHRVPCAVARLQLFILCMDRQNLSDAKRIAQGPAELHLFVDGMDVPDPYYGGETGFEQVYTMLEKASIEWIEQWSKKTNS